MPMRRLFVILLFVGSAIILHSQSFSTLVYFNSSNGFDRYASLIQGADWSFFWSTDLGGDNGGDGGTVFKLARAGTVTTLHGFSGSEGAAPQAGLVLATDGNFYGTTTVAGVNRHGTVFRITPDGVLSTCMSSGPMAPES